MRHADYRTTLKHYTQLELEDDAAALRKITGPSSFPSSQRTIQCETTREDATDLELKKRSDLTQPPVFATPCDAKRRAASDSSTRVQTPGRGFLIRWVFFRRLIV